MENLSEITVLVSLVTGLTEAVKRTFGDNLKERVVPVVAIILGVLLSILAGRGILDGVVVGLMSMGLYSGGKTVLQK